MKIFFSRIFKRESWSRGETILFLERAELYISAGLTLDQTLIAIEESSSKNKINSVQNVRRAVERGISFSMALATNLKFNNTIVSIVRQGEQSGSLAQALNSSRALVEKKDELIKKCLSALAYPIIIALCAGILTVGLLRGIMPQIIPTLKSLNVKLPLLTKIVIFVSEEIANRGLWYLLFLLFIGFVFKKLYKKYFKIKKFVQNFILRLPIIGRLFFYYHLSVALRSMGTLIDTGISLTTSYKSIYENIEFIPLYNLLKSHIVNIEKGAAVSEIFKWSYVPEYIAPLISAGEKTGNLGVSMLRASSILDRGIEHSLKRITALIEPLMMVIMGGIIGAIALSIMLPIYDVSKVLQK